MCYTLKRIGEILKKNGLLALSKKFLFYPIQLLYSLYCVLKIKKFRHDYSIDKLLDFVFTDCRGLIKPFQVREEILKLLMILNRMKPQTILEIGTATGGTLFLFSRIISDDGTIISIDLPSGSFGGGYPIWKKILYKSFSLSRQKIYLIRADSHKKKTLDNVKYLLRGREIDFLFIDGDHTYQGVKKDFEMYNSLIRQNGVIAFHDIAVNSIEADCQVSKFWNEIKKRYEYTELIKNCEQNWGGIGLLLVK